MPPDLMSLFLLFAEGNDADEALSRRLTEQILHSDFNFRCINAIIIICYFCLPSASYSPAPENCN